MTLRYATWLASAVLAASATWLSAAEAQSWCRNRDLSHAERLICRTPALQTLDRNLNVLYRDAVKATKPGSAVGIRESQHIWLGRRNACGLDEACIRAAYATRDAALRRYIATGDLDLE